MKSLFLFLFLYTTSIGAQPIQPQQINTELQKARVYESQNDLANAQRIYKNLYAQYPSRGDIAMRLENIYTRTGQHDKAIALLKQHLKQSPNDITTHLKLGDALFAVGNKEEAFAAWENVLHNVNSPNPFILVANRYMQNSLYDRATAVYRQGRAVLKMPQIFAKELAELAERQTRYADAVQEYLIFVQQSPQYRTMLEARLREMAQSGDQHKEIFGLLATAVQNDPGNRNNLGLLVEYALPAGFSTQVLHILQNTPNLPTHTWTYLARIARYAIDEKKFETAIEAYQTLYADTTQPDVRARALIGLAYTYHTAQNVQQARQHYRAVIDQFGSRPEADEARFHMARFQRESDNNLKEAQKTLLEILQTNRKNQWRYRAFFELAEVYLQMDQFEQAEKTWTQILAERQSGPDAAQARFALADLHYYKGDFGTAKVLLNLITMKDMGQNVANDAILKLALIEEGEQKDSEQLKKYAQAEWVRRQQKLEEAYAAFEKLEKQQTFLQDRILFQQAELLEQQKQYIQAIQHYRKLTQTLTDSPLCPASQMAMAQIYETRLSQYHDAKRAYETLLVNYPLSFEADLARERLRQIQQKIQTLETPKETG